MVDNIQLTKDIWLYDYLKSSTAERYPLVLEEQHNPSQAVIDNLFRFAEEIDQPLIDLWEVGMINKTSTWRCLDFKHNGVLQKGLNTLVGSSPTSAHPKGLAGDREPYIHVTEGDGKTYKQFIQMMIEHTIPFDKIIIEGGTLLKPAWIHIQINQDPTVARGIVLRWGKDTGYAYKPFDIDIWKP